MKPVLAFISSIALLVSSCSQPIYLNGTISNKPEIIKVKNIHAVIMETGEIYTAPFQLNNGLLYQDITPINLLDARAIEVRETRPGDIFAAPFEFIGSSSALLGGLIIYFGGLETEDDEETNWPLFAAGVSLVAGGLAVRHVGRSMRPSEKKSIRTIYLEDGLYIPSE